MRAPDTQKSSIVTDHDFEPRTRPVFYGRLPEGRTIPKYDRFLPPNPYLCQHCNLAEASHAR